MVSTSNKNVVFTILIQQNSLDCSSLSICVATQKAYAERIGADFVCLTEKKVGSELDCIYLEKLYIIELLEKYNRVLYMDADIMITKNAPNIFDEYSDESKLTICNERPYNYPTNIQKNYVWMKLTSACVKFGFPVECVVDKYYNAGIMLCSKCHKRLFESFNLARFKKMYRTFETDRLLEQDYFNALLMHSRVPVVDLCSSFNYFKTLESEYQKNKIKPVFIHYVVHTKKHIMRDFIECYGEQEGRELLEKYTDKTEQKANCRCSRAILTTFLPSENPDICDQRMHCIMTQKLYAEKTNSDFVLITEREVGNKDDIPDIEKYIIAQLLNKYDRILCLDSNVFVHPNAPNIFEWYNNCQDCLLLTRVEIDKNSEAATKKYEATAAAYKYIGVKPVEPKLGSYFNTNIFLCSKSHKSVFEKFDISNFRTYYNSYSNSLMVDQDYLNALILSSGCKVKPLLDQFNCTNHITKDSNFYFHKYTKNSSGSPAENKDVLLDFKKVFGVISV